MITVKYVWRNFKIILTNLKMAENQNLFYQISQNPVDK